MCPGIRPATGWIAYLTSTPAGLEELGQLAHGVLRLGHGETVARDDDDGLRVGQLDRDVVRADLADRAARPGGRAGRLSPPPKPPTMMFRTDRFMASAMSLVRIAPEAPTRAPAMMSTGLPRTNPAMAAAVPVNELSRLMTTGMSAPPIGRTIVTPKISAGQHDETEERERRAARGSVRRQIRGSAPGSRRTATAAIAIVTSWPPGT